MPDSGTCHLRRRIPANPIIVPAAPRGPTIVTQAWSGNARCRRIPATVAAKAVVTRMPMTKKARWVGDIECSLALGRANRRNLNAPLRYTEPPAKNRLLAIRELGCNPRVVKRQFSAFQGLGALRDEFDEKERADTA